MQDWNLRREIKLIKNNLIEALELRNLILKYNPRKAALCISSFYKFLVAISSAYTVIIIFKNPKQRNINETQ